MMSEAEKNIKFTPVILVGVDFGRPHFDGSLEELGLLADAAGMRAAARVTCKRSAPDAALFIGSGKADEIKTLADIHGAKEVLFDQALSPAQQRNLERHLQMPVNDRTLLILEIFAQRARSHEGKLQVELARLQYLSTRLVRRWSHLERQKGGIGARGGPGETQIEMDRRMISDAVSRIKDRLVKVKRQHATQRRRRDRNGVFQVALVGYTNAGKSSIFNALVKAGTYAADQLFATLDTTTRQLYLQEAGKAVSLSDTVGFIRDLPHGLIEAFRATLQETAEADLLIHVVDFSSEHFREQIDHVQRVLKEIGADEVKQVIVFNKIDMVGADSKPAIPALTYDLEGRSVDCVYLSAKTSDGLPALRSYLATLVIGNVEPTMDFSDSQELQVGDSSLDTI
jgi:GTPase